MPTRKQINRGFYGFKTDDAEFLKPSSQNPYEASASGVGYNAKFDDDAGTRKLSGDGDNVWNTWQNDISATNAEFLEPSWTGDRDYVQGGAYRVVDNQQDQPAGKILGGGGNVADNVGQKARRYAAKRPGPQTPRGSKGGI